MKTWGPFLFFLAILAGILYYFTLGRPTVTPEATVSSGQFSCDGRKYCSQMHSCMEAQFFAKNCPGTMMDGDQDKVPCEKEWCGHSISQQNHFGVKN